jgi:pimeloyl-CoA dehydrogenase small subunit
MDFDLSEDQRLLKDSIDRMIDDAYGDFEKRRAHQAGAAGWDGALWASFAEMGLLGLPFAEADGGFGGGAVETMLVMEAIGRGLVVEPYLASIVLGGGVLRRAGSAAQKETLIPQLADGTLTMALAHGEAQARYDLHDVAATATPRAGGHLLDGRKAVVLHGDSAGQLVVSARTAGGRRDRDGITLFLVPADAPGVTRRGYPTQDGLRAADITLEAVAVGPEAVLGTIGQGLPVIEAVVDAAIAALCAEAVGAMEVLHATTVDYLKQRKQFGVAIGSFQALAHRAADMLVMLEQSRSMAMYAAMMAEAPDAQERRIAIASAKVLVSQAADRLGREAIQMHGGIGMTEEYKAGHYFKRLSVIAGMFGDADHHLKLVAAAA